MLENTNEKALQQYGSKLIEVTTHQLKANQTLEDKFKTLVSAKLVSSNVQSFQAELTSVYYELTRKLYICNTRIEEFLSYQYQISVAKQGNATSGQNSRDTLLLQHVNRLVPEFTCACTLRGRN